jgi:hypothetical protein
MRPIVIAAVALLAVGIANIDVHPTETKTKVVKVPVTKVVTKTKVKTVYEDAPVPLGVMARADCKKLARLHPAPQFREIVARYGWPEGKNGEDSGSDMLYYKLTDGSGDECEMQFWQGALDTVDIEEDWL